MGKWGFVWLAYGAAGAAILGYLAALCRRLREAADELTGLEERPGRGRS